MSFFAKDFMANCPFSEVFSLSFLGTDPRINAVFCEALLHVYTSWKEITYRKPEHVSAGEEEATDRVPVLPEHRLKRIRHIGLQV